MTMGMYVSFRRARRQHHVVPGTNSGRRDRKTSSNRGSAAYVPAYDIALVCAGLGWKDQALDYLSRAHQERSGWMTYINVDPRLDPLREDPRFIDLLLRMRLINPG